MSKFNPASSNAPDSANLAGGAAYTQDAKMELVSILLTSFVEDQYYRSASDTTDRLKALMDKVDPLFAAKAAIYARHEFKLRSVSHIVAGEIAHRVKGETWTKDFFNKVVHRPDDMLEILGYYYSLAGKNTEPNAMKRGFAKRLAQFDGYQLAKYKATGKEINLFDLINLVHPKSTPALDAFMRGEIISADTWETKISATGGKDKTAAETKELKGQVWLSLLSEHKLGYMALLRNLRNIIEVSNSDSESPLIAMAAATLIEPSRVKKSMVLPFRFYTAYQEISKLHSPHARTILSALSRALDISLNNIPEFTGRSAVFIDHSGSMDSGISSKSVATPFQTAALFGLALAKKNNADIFYFGGSAKPYNVTGDSTLGQLQWLERCNSGWRGGQYHVGHGTNFSAAFKAAGSTKYDRIFIFSDMQSWGGNTIRGLQAYKRASQANPRIYAFDLGGYGTAQFNPKGEQGYQLAGFSEKIFSVLQLLEQDKNALINNIEKVTF